MHTEFDKDTITDELRDIKHLLFFYRKPPRLTKSKINYEKARKALLLC